MCEHCSKHCSVFNDIYSGRMSARRTRNKKEREKEKKWKANYEFESLTTKLGAVLWLHGNLCESRLMNTVGSIRRARADGLARQDRLLLNIARPPKQSRRVNIQQSRNDFVKCRSHVAAGWFVSTLLYSLPLSLSLSRQSPILGEYRLTFSICRAARGNIRLAPPSPPVLEKWLPGTTAFYN